MVERMDMVKAQPPQARPYQDGEDAMQMDGRGGVEGDGINGFHGGIMDGVMTSLERGNGGLVQPTRTSELTVAFEGEVYVFPAVTPEKVSAFLSLISGFYLIGRILFCFFSAFSGQREGELGLAFLDWPRGRCVSYRSFQKEG